MRRLLLLTILVAGLCGAPAAAAAGAAPNPVADCNAHGTLTRHYTVTQLRNGLRTMPADIKEYSNCYDVLQRQLLAQLGKRQTGAGVPQAPSSSGGSFLPTPVIVVLVVLVLGAAAIAAVALRRRRSGGENDRDGP
jgi:hypothetical protein